MKERDILMDILRIFACLMVVLLHVAATYMNPFDSVCFNMTDWQIASIFDSTTRWTVPVFVMISGAFMLRKNIPIDRLFKKYIYRLVLVLFIWNIIYHFDVILNEFTLKKIISCVLLPHKSYHLWFIYMLITCYAFIPILKKIVDAGLSKYFLVLWLLADVMFFGIGSFESNSLNFIAHLKHCFLKDISIGYLGYFVLGYYLYNNTTLTTKRRFVIYSFGIICLVVIILGTLWLGNIPSTNTFLFYENMNPFVVLLSTSVFVAFTPPIPMQKGVIIYGYIQDKS